MYTNQLGLPMSAFPVLAKPPSYTRSGNNIEVVNMHVSPKS